MKHEPATEATDQLRSSSIVKRAKALTPESAFTHSLAEPPIMTDVAIAGVAARAYRRANLLPWRCTLAALTTALGLSTSPVAATSEIDDDLSRLERLASGLLDATAAAGSGPDRCRLMLDLSLPLPLLQVSQALGLLAAPALHLPPWFMRIGYARLGQSGVMSRPFQK